MNKRTFDWDDDKADSNESKHGIKFHDAVYVFGDACRTERWDDSQDYGEDRWITTGLAQGRVLVVVYTGDADDEDPTRLITARKANASEQKEYYNARDGRSG